MGTKVAGLDERTRASIAAYDRRAREYQETLRRKRPVADVRRFAGLAQRGDRVLDVGCGPASDLRLLRDAGVHPIGMDLSMGALTEARLLLPRHGLVRAPYQRAPFRPGSFGGLWMSGSFNHLPRDAWAATFASLLGLLASGPVYFSCVRGTGDLDEIDDPVLGTVFRSDATEAEIELLFQQHALVDVQVELRPDPILDRRRAWVVALGRRA
ncbi:MAG TPA: class I SAM-dependent methyltransferase [Nitriliruptorales bacterium]